MKIIFADTNYAVADALAMTFEEEYKQIQVFNKDIFNYQAEAIVSPANSFGYMNGGIDLAYVRHFGFDLQDRVLEAIDRIYDKEIPVGKSIGVPIYGSAIQMLIVTPTMYIPMSIVGTVNVYLAFRAALKFADNEGLDSLLCPGMGTGIGKVDPKIAASQMHIAYLEVMKKINAVQAMSMLIETIA